MKNNCSKGSLEAKRIQLEEIEKGNITNESFYIQKIVVKMISGEEKRSFLASIKYQRPDSFLISVRAATGIEIARILLTKDTILINDRINKILLHGSEIEARKKYGMDSRVFAVILGDLIISKKEKISNNKCDNGYATYEVPFENGIIKYSINCNLRKAESVSIKNEIENNQIKISLSYKRIEKRTLPKKVIISNFNGIELLKISYGKIDIPYEGGLIFIPGKNYELVKIR